MSTSEKILKHKIRNTTKNPDNDLKVRIDKKIKNMFKTNKIAIKVLNLIILDMNIVDSKKLSFLETLSQYGCSSIIITMSKYIEFLLKNDEIEDINNNKRHLFMSILINIDNNKDNYFMFNSLESTDSEDSDKLQSEIYNKIKGLL